MINKYFFVHGHFYQPAREDAITGLIPKEHGVYPYQNWNERIHAECYKPNAELGNFEHISFNIGPTLFSWMESYDPGTYQMIIEQENINYRNYGVGNAMAQPYNHTILPLDNFRDKVTQVKWGIADYIHRYGHTPSGMWLPEAAVDYETLEILADNGIRFTILAPWQADSHDLDITQPYKVELSNNISIIVFFYQRDISTRLSFDPDSTENADKFIQNHLLPVFRDPREQELLAAVSDGELYGHHQPFRDKFLDRLMTGPELDGLVQSTYPAKYLQTKSILKTCKIRQNTSWSCHHGISRWYEDCGCTPGSSWKTNLRAGLKAIAEQLDAIFEYEMFRIHADPWQLRNDYIRVKLGETQFRNYLMEHGINNLDLEAETRFHFMLDSQVARQKMFTSCGFFFGELNRIEPRNNIAYAAQAAALLNQATGGVDEASMAKLLATVHNASGDVSGETIFRESYEQAKQNLLKIQSIGIKSSPVI
jgi:alpha-amylase/alpha-mannosidase (GH57 family)